LSSSAKTSTACRWRTSRLGNIASIPQTIDAPQLGPSNQAERRGIVIVDHAIK
jgi:hypothetical protein